MPLWFEVVVLVLLACIAVCLIDVCFQLESINKNFANFGTRLEAEALPRLETAIRKGENE
jgi:hypothetical protein